MEPILTIGITSYKRLDELIRCIKSVNTKYKSDIEILVSEDKSPLSAEIKEAVETLAKQSEYMLKFTTNEQNLGYDMNLGSIIQKSKGEYIFFMSDDDALTENCLDEIVEFLKSKKEYGVLYAPFIFTQNEKLGRFRGNDNHVIEASEDNAAKYIYDSILFSGLIFKKECVLNYDSSRFKNHNYFQVYLFLQMLYKIGGYYFGKPSVLCIGDGENAYGLSESSGGNDLLANRKSIKSNLEFNKTLIKVIKMFDEDEETHVFKSFERQYSLHSYSGMSIARAQGLQYFKEYWKTFNELDIRKYPITKAYYVILFIFGKNNSDKLLSGFRRLVSKGK